MEIVLLSPVMHRGAEQMLIRFNNLKTLNDAVRKLPSVRWSSTYKCWYFTLSEENYKLSGLLFIS